LTFLSGKRHSGKAETRLLDILRQGLAKEFPNPERIGCPGSALLKGIAQRRVSLTEAEPWFEHLGSCSPCFQEFTQFRAQEASQRRRIQVWIAAAAVLVFAMAGWLWERTRPSVQTTATVFLDLRERSVARGQNPSDSSQLPLHVPHTAKHLILDLPIGNREGSYDVALLGETGDEIVRTAGTAQLENHVVILRADVDFVSVRPGSYFLGVRQPGLDWTRFALRVD
jgi:hypothetical protein